MAVVLAGFRQRIETDLSAAGIALKWRVDVVPRVRWLDAPNTLHILRIFQEIVANVVKHANATEIEVRCHAQHSDGVGGVLVEFLDNGIGLDDTLPDTGKGLTNMSARAAALKAKLVVKMRDCGHGTKASLWLPSAH